MNEVRAGAGDRAPRVPIAVIGGMGQGCGVHGRVMEGLFMLSADQEHGIFAGRDGAPAPRLPVGPQP